MFVSLRLIIYGMRANQYLQIEHIHQIKEYEDSVNY